MTLLSIVLAFVPSMDVQNKFLYVVEIVVGTAVAAGLGVMLYMRGARVKATETA